MFGIAFLLAGISHGQVQAAGGGTVYYIAVNGSSSNTGTSADSPWPMSKVGSTAFAPGDTILFHKGDTFNNTALSFSRSGSAGLPIMFGSYGTGANPVLDGGGASTPIFSISNAAYITIDDLVIQNSTSDNGGIYLYDSHDITIHNDYFTNVATGLYVQSCTNNIVFDGNYALNMQGPFPRGQMVQFNTVSGSGNAITNNKLQDIMGQSHPEDAINLYMSNGTAGSPILVSGNQIEGGGPSTSGGGIMLGDGGGSYQKAVNNVLVNPGQYGIAISGGSNLEISSNQIYAGKSAFTNVGIYVYNQSSDSCSATTVSNNQVSWINSDGVSNPYWDKGNCGTVNGWDGNIAATNLAASLLSNPLWSGAPWSTVSSIVPPPVTIPPVTPVTVSTGGGGSGTSVTVSTPPAVVSYGGGGGGSFSSSMPTASVSPATTTTTSAGIPVGCLSSTAFSTVTGQRCPNFTGIVLTKALSFGSHDVQVQILQHFLNTHNFPVALSGSGSLNNETIYFGAATRSAVKEFQMTNGIPPVGTVGPLTRAAINRMITV